MTERDFLTVSSVIEENKEFLNSISQDIWKTPEIGFKEVNAHSILTSALETFGFLVQKHYFLNTAFRAEFKSSEEIRGPTVAVLCEYDALPEIGHACGHNLIAEAGLAAAVAVKKAMQADPTLVGKLVVLGTPAEEDGGGKIHLLNSGAFDDIDAAMMVHPASGSATVSTAAPDTLCINQCTVTYKGKEAHASTYPWEGRNALDAAVASYGTVAMLRQQIKPGCWIHAIITKGGVAANVIPAETTMEFYIRAPAIGQLKNLQSRVEACVTGAAEATGCEVSYCFEDSTLYQNLVSNQKLMSLYKHFGNRLGTEFTDDQSDSSSLITSAST